MTCYNRFIGRDNMPSLSKCWYKDCDSHPREDPKLLFYKFPKDLDRCGKWIANCANSELAEIRKNNPERFANLRVCQKHFLREFLGSSWRLVGHAVPLPYGMSLYGADAERFMVDCANLKITSNIHRWHQRSLQKHQKQPPRPSRVQLRSCLAASQNLDLTSQSTIHQITPNKSNNDDHHYQQPLHPRSSNSLEYSVVDNNHEVTINLDGQQEYHQLVSHPIPQDNTTSSTDLPSNPSCVTATSSYEPNIWQQANENLNLQRQEIITIHLPQTSQQTTPNRQEQNANPKISYDRGGNVLSIKYPDETVTLAKSEMSEKEQNNVHIAALKQKIRHYQRRLAVRNHRYQKLLAQKIGGRSIKGKLLENLKLCKDDFNPCVYELFRTQIKAPSSRNGNRWSDTVKSFSASIYMRSRSAYKFVRKTIDLPSESIVKRFIEAKKLNKRPSKGSGDNQGNNGGGDTENIDDDDDDEEDDGDVDDVVEAEGNSSLDEGLLVQPTN